MHHRHASCIMHLAKTKNDPINEDDLKNEDNLKNEEDLKNTDNLENGDDLRIVKDHTALTYTKVVVMIFFIQVIRQC